MSQNKFYRKVNSVNIGLTCPVFNPDKMSIDLNMMTFCRELLFQKLICCDGKRYLCVKHVDLEYPFEKVLDIYTKAMKKFLKKSLVGFKSRINVKRISVGRTNKDKYLILENFIPVNTAALSIVAGALRSLSLIRFHDPVVDLLRKGVTPKGVITQIVKDMDDAVSRFLVSMAADVSKVFRDNGIISANEVIGVPGRSINTMRSRHCLYPQRTIVTAFDNVYWNIRSMLGYNSPARPSNDDVLDGVIKLVVSLNGKQYLLDLLHNKMGKEIPRELIQSSNLFLKGLTLEKFCAFITEMVFGVDKTRNSDALYENLLRAHAPLKYSLENDIERVINSGTYKLRTNYTSSSGSVLIQAINSLVNTISLMFTIEKV